MQLALAKQIHWDNVVPIPTPQHTFAGEEIDKFLQILKKITSARRVRINLTASCGPKEAQVLATLEKRGFVELFDESRRMITAIYVADNGCGHMARSLMITVLDTRFLRSRQLFRNLAPQIETIELFAA